MEFDEKTRWAINILISHAVCACIGLSCDEYCPSYNSEKFVCKAVWNDEDIVNAVRWLNGRKGEL
jgi:hypothetical protein